MLCSKMVCQLCTALHSPAIAALDGLTSGTPWQLSHHHDPRACYACSLEFDDCLNLCVMTTDVGFCRS